nr:hypothetical protein [Macrococcus goetzii]
MDYEKAYKDLRISIYQARDEVEEEYSQADDVLDELIYKIEQLEKENDG